MNKNVIQLLFVLIFFSQAVVGQTDVMLFSETKPLSKTKDHHSEGFLVTDVMRKIHMFRTDPGIEGDHTGNKGSIAIHSTKKDPRIWIPVKIIYSDKYDNRNVHGGILEDGRIILTFRRYDAVKEKHIDTKIMYSDNNGLDWSRPKTMKTDALASGTHKIIHIPGKGYLNAFVKQNYVEIRFSEDGIKWEKPAKIWDYTNSDKYSFSEACFEYVGNNTIIGLLRNNDKDFGSFFQVVSRNNGESWTEPEVTNIAIGNSCPAPCLEYDEKTGDIIVIACDRKNGVSFDNINKESQIWIYRNRPKDVIDNPMAYKIFNILPRPLPNDYRFYGYPTISKDLHENYLVIFTESYREINNTEGADLYQFSMKMISDKDPDIQRKEGRIDIDLTSISTEYQIDSVLVTNLYDMELFRGNLTTGHKMSIPDEVSDVIFIDLFTREGIIRVRHFF